MEAHHDFSEASSVWELKTLSQKTKMEEDSKLLPDEKPQGP